MAQPIIRVAQQSVGMPKPGVGVAQSSVGVAQQIVGATSKIDDVLIEYVCHTITVTVHLNIVWHTCSVDHSKPFLFF